MSTTINAQPEPTPCPCGDSYCSDRMPTNQDRSDCCMYCGYYDCDVCGWSDPHRTLDLKTGRWTR